MIQNLQDALQNSLLSKIFNQAKLHLLIDQLLKTHLDETLRQHCQVAQLQEGVLIVHVTNGAWLIRILPILPELVQALKTHPFLATLQKIQCKVRPFDFTEKNL